MSDARFTKTNLIKFQNTFLFMVQTKKPHVSKNLYSALHNNATMLVLSEKQ
jgi:hypothetical protein